MTRLQKEGGVAIAGGELSPAAVAADPPSGHWYLHKLYGNFEGHRILCDAFELSDIDVCFSQQVVDRKQDHVASQ